MSGFLDVFFPPACVACDTVLGGPGYFCEACSIGLEETPPLRCRKCAEPGTFPSGSCTRCERRPPNFDEAFAPFEHTGPVAKAIHRFKYEERADLARPLGGLLAWGFEPRFVTWHGAKVVPVPLHVERYQERGYDQATLLAVWFSKATGLELADGWLTRTKATERQVGQSEAAREANVGDAFEARGVSGADVILVDDVYTTGATGRAATAAMRAGGAGRVLVLTLARTRRADEA